MRTTFGPPRLVVLDVPHGYSFDVFRIVRSNATEDPVLVNSLRSHFAMSQAPRAVERSSAAVHMGISVFDDKAAAVGTAQRFPKLGDYIARLHLRSDMGFNFAHTGQPTHLTVWADPIKLCNAVADIFQVPDY